MEENYAINHDIAFAQQHGRRDLLAELRRMVATNGIEALPTVMNLLADAQAQVPISIGRFKEISKREVYTKTNNDGNENEDRCGICYADYEDSDRLRRLNVCKHVFHHSCIKTQMTKYVSPRKIKI